jgi:flavin-dependent dehydrogenase
MKRSARSVGAIQISGAGPAGLAAALTIAKAGARAVVYERLPDVGGRFHGDFQGLENWTTESDALTELAAIGIEPSFEASPIRELVFFDPGGREYLCRSGEPLFYLVRRGSEPGTLDHSLKAQALAAGVELRFSEPKDHLPEGGIVAQGPRTADAVAVGYVFETDMPDCILGAASDWLAPKGYSYLLVHRGRGTVASCLLEDFHSEKTYVDRTLEFFRRKAGLRMKNERRFGGVGNFVYPATAQKGRMLVVGEAAGFQDALWGFGMRYAMVSGHLAARALINQRPEQYNQLWTERLGGLMRTGVVNRWVYERLGDSGYAAIMRFLSPPVDVRDWLHHRYAASIWKSLFFPLVRRMAADRLNRRQVVCVTAGCDCTWCRCQHAGTPFQQVAG